MAMKRNLIVLVALLAFAGLGLAQKFAIYTGYPLGLGGMYYLSENMRVDGAFALITNGFGIGGGLDLILDKAPLSEEEGAAPLSYYYGVGASASFLSWRILGVSGSAFSLGANGFGGLEYKFSDTLGGFFEVGAGPVMVFASVSGYGGSGFGFGFFGRLGLNFY